MIKEWHLKVNDDQEHYTLIVEDDDYKWVMPNVSVTFEANGCPMIGTIRALPEKSQKSSFVITIPDETEVW